VPLHLLQYFACFQVPQMNNPVFKGGHKLLTMGNICDCVDCMCVIF
jgi:hypothetical protein